MTCPHLDPWFVFAVGSALAITALLIASYLRHVAMRVRFADHAFDILGRLKDEEPSYETAYARLNDIEQWDKRANRILRHGTQALDYAARRERFNEESGT